MSETINYGIDLGTTNSAIAIYTDGEVEVFKNPSNLKQSLASVVAYKGDRIIVGDKARELLKRTPNSVFGTFKRKMGTSDKYFLEATDGFISPVELSAIIIKELKNFIHSGDNPDSVVITIPAAFDTMQSNATKKAGYQAGFSEVILLQEPIAASLAFANKSANNLADGKWLVYDFGGGTFDVALTSISDGEMKIIDHEGDNYLGGTDFDRAIIDKYIIPAMNNLGVFNNLEAELKKTSGKYNRLYNKLLYIAEEAKIELSNSDISELEFEVVDDTGNSIDIYLELDKSTFESIIKPDIDRTVLMIKEVMLRNQLTARDLNCVLLIGGTTYIPYVKQILHDELGLTIDSSMDPTTAVVVGAAYFAGTKLKSTQNVKTTTSSDTIKSKLKIRLAYDRVVQTDTTPILCRAEYVEEGYKYRIIRKDGGYDSGLLPLEDKTKNYLSVAAQVYNTYVLTVYNSAGDKLYKETIGITHGKFGIDGQPLPDNICLVVDAVDENTTYLEPIFKKNDILPLKKTITKQISKTIPRNSNDRLIIKVVEGSIDTLPSANKLIGLIEISGSKLERDLIKGSDVELTFEITESRDIKVAAYLSLTDQEFNDTFSPTEHHVSETELLRETKYFKDNLLAKQKDYELDANYEKAEEVKNILFDVINLEEEIGELEHDDISDTKYKIDIRKRKLGAKIHTFYSRSFLTKTIELYYDQKINTTNSLLAAKSTESDSIEFQNLISEEKVFLNEGNITVIKSKIEQLKNIATKIYNRDSTPITPDDILMAFRAIQYQKFKNQTRASKLISDGEMEIARENYNGLYFIVSQLIEMMDKEKNSDTDTFRSDGTGLK